jgi:hypothetical protein
MVHLAQAQGINQIAPDLRGKLALVNGNVGNGGHGLYYTQSGRNNKRGAAIFKLI